jgi:hypothetical protein
MNCHFCGKSLGIAAAAAGDPDFCSTQHRRNYHSRLMKALNLVGGDFAQAPRLVGPVTGFVPVDCLPQPALSMAPVSRLRLPAASFEILTDPRPAPEAKTPPLAMGGGAGAKPDRLADLGSRLRGLRNQLDRASGVQRQLATA